MRRLFLKLFRRRKLQLDLEAELAFHREMAEAAGNSIPFGHASSIKEQALEIWRFNFVENLWRDVLYGVRSLRRSSALVFSAVLSLALGIGANTAIFSLAVEFLLSEPSVRDSSSLTYVRLGGDSHLQPRVIDMLQESGVFAAVTGENEETFINWNDGTETHRIYSVVTTKNYFSALGIPVAYGRGILPTDPNEVVVLENSFWRRHFNGDQSIVGRAINLDGRAYTVVGILPADHRTLIGYGYTPDVYLPRYLDNTILAAYARLKPGMTLGQATAALHTVGTRIDAEFRGDFKYAEYLHATPVAGFARVGKDAMTIGLFFGVLLILVGLVLLIACVNVAGLLLARASARRREIAIRLSLGAGRGRLLQQLMVESLLLSIAGAACGFGLAHVIATLAARVQLPLPVPIQIHITPGWRVAIYAALLTAGSTIACGLLPALQSVKQSVNSDLHRENRFRLRQILVAGQITVTLIVLTTGFLFLRNLLQASAISPGFDVRKTLRAEVNLPPAAYKDSKKILVYVERGLRSLESLPGIEAAAAARIIPFIDSTRFGTDLTLPGSGITLRAGFNWNAVTPDYFRVMDIRVRQGRTFLPTDSGAAKVVIVNRSFVTKYLNDQQPVGITFLWGDNKKAPYRIVGVADDTKNMTIGEENVPQLYEPFAQIANDRTRLQFVLRSSLPPALQLDAVRRVLRDIEPGAACEVSTLYSSIGFAFLPSQIGAVLMGSVGLLGLTLAAVGLYGTMIYSVTRRTREIGIRMAIGASRLEISRMILLEILKLILAGSAAGLFIAWFVTKPLAQFLVPGVKSTDLSSYIAVLAVLAATGVIASWGPLRRAIRIDPAVSLRYE